MSDHKYFNFPIYLLDGFLINSEECLNNILYYALYNHIYLLEEGDDLHKIKSSAKFYNVSMGSPKHVLRRGEELVEGKIAGYPMIGINTEIFWDFKGNYKSVFEKACLLGFLAIKSILQQKPYCKITNKFWLARMDGEAKSCEYEFLSPEIRKYTNEYQLRKIKNALVDGWNLITYSRYNRGFYVSFKLSLLELIINAEKQKVGYKDKVRKQEKRQIYLEVLKQLNNINKEKHGK